MSSSYGDDVAAASRTEVYSWALITFVAAVEDGRDVPAFKRSSRGSHRGCT